LPRWVYWLGGVILLVALMTQRGERTSEPAATTDVMAVLRIGDGHDWARLSDRDKLILCNVIAEKTGRHTGWQYREFLENFYYDQNVQNTDIAEAAAVAAALDLKDE
jgi:hypothetical protein